MNTESATTPTVWIVNAAGHDYSDASRFGDLKPLSVGNISPLRVDRVMFSFSEGIGRRATEDDYLLISGSPMLNALAVVMWLRRFPECKVLQWDAKQRSYILTQLTTKHMDSIMEEALMKG